jgi:hypothetical protein
MRERPGRLRKIAGALIVAVLVLQLLGCGTILYPERRSQPAGKLDTDIVLLDGVGLLFFLIPGVIAFAVDFATGAIYLPAGGRSRVGDLFGGVRTIPFDPAHTDPHGLPALIERETGLEIRLARSRTWALDVQAPEDVEAQVREANLAIARSSNPAG